MGSFRRHPWEGSLVDVTAYGKLSEWAVFVAPIWAISNLGRLRAILKWHEYTQMFTIIISYTNL